MSNPKIRAHKTYSSPHELIAACLLTKMPSHARTKIAANPPMNCLISFFMKTMAMMVSTARTTNRIIVSQSVPIPLGKAFPRSAAHVPILGTPGRIPIMARINRKKPTQQAHQSSFTHKDDQSIFFN